MLRVGDMVKDQDENVGIVGIFYNDGDFTTIENDAAHPNPQPCKDNNISRRFLITRKKPDFDIWWRENRKKLLSMYNNEPDLDLAIMGIAKTAWEGIGDLLQPGI